MGKPYYQKTQGLRFECTRCGDCCTRPGPVYLPRKELHRIAEFIGLSPRAFRARYHVHPVDGVPSIDPGDDKPCPFYDSDTGCTVFEIRPTQCRTFPFWPELVGRKRSWEKTARGCEGIHQGRRHTPLEIEELVIQCEKAGLPEGDPW